ncbi:MAG TPA: universal stress protein [Stenomitos sp.]
MNVPPSASRRKELAKALGIFGLFSIGYGNVGSSIYYALGVVAAAALGATPLAFLIAGLFFVITAYTYAEGTAMFPESGGSSSFARHGFNEAISFIAGWALMLDYIVTIAISAASSAFYLSYFVPVLKTAHAASAGLAIAIVLVLAVVNIRGARESAAVNNFSVFADALTQLLIIALGMGLLFNWQRLLSYPHVPGQWPSMHQFIYSVSIAMVAFTGIESVSQMAEESHEPAKTVPRAIGMVVLAVLVMYAGINAVGFSALSPSEVGSTWALDPVQGIVSALPQPLAGILGPWVALLAASILLIATNAGLMGVSRLAFSMGMHRQLPGPFYKLHPTYSTPFLAIAFFAAITVLLLATGFFSDKLLFNLADLYSFGAMLSFTIAHASILALRWRHPELERPWKLPCNVRVAGREIPLTAVLGVMSTFAVWLVVVVVHPWGRLVGFLWLFAGMLLYIFHRQSHELPLTSTVIISQLEPILVDLSMKRILVPTIGTPFSEEMVAVACRLGKRERAKVTALYVFEVPMALPVGSQVPTELTKAEEILTRARQIGEGIGLEVEARFVQSRSAGMAIVEAVKELEADLLLMGISPRERLGQAALGSTINHVLKKAPCRVLLSRPPLDQGKPDPMHPWHPGVSLS